MPQKIIWMPWEPQLGDRYRLGGYETIYKNQYFWKCYHPGGVSLHVTCEYSGVYIPSNPFECIYCNCGGIDYAVRLFKPNDQTKTKYTDFELCPVGFCHRIRFRINGRFYWAKWNPFKKRFMVFNKHHRRTPMGTLPKYVFPKNLWGST